MPARGSTQIAAVLAAGVLAWAQNPPAPAQRTSAAADRLEARLQSNPGDVTVRAQLIRFYSRPRFATDKARILRGQHILWMIENDPANDVLGVPAGTIDPEGGALADAYGYGMADRAWRNVLRRADAPARALSNAANFYRSPDPEFARRIVEGGLKRFPDDAGLGAAAGTLLALTVLGGTVVDGTGTAISVDDRLMTSPEAAAARSEIEGASNLSLLGAATAFLTQQFPALRVRLRPQQLKGMLDFQARCYERAIAVDPGNARWKSGLRTVYRTAAAVPARPADRYIYLERAARVPGTDAENLSLLPELAQARLETQAPGKAAEAAEEALRLAAQNPGAAAGYAVHVGNIVMGRLALGRGDIAEAKARLLAAGRTPGAPVLNSAGPDWQLASDLLARNEKGTVLEYIELCRKFWRRDGGKLDAYAAAIRAGDWPGFQTAR